MAEIIWTPAAREDLKQMSVYLAVEKKLPHLADQLVDEIVAKCERYAGQPEMGTLCSELASGVRLFSHKRYVVFYQALDDGIEVLRVMHGSRDYLRLFHADYD